MGFTRLFELQFLGLAGAAWGAAGALRKKMRLKLRNTSSQESPPSAPNFGANRARIACRLTIMGSGSRVSSSKDTQTDLSPRQGRCQDSSNSSSAGE